MCIKIQDVHSSKEEKILALVVASLTRGILHVFASAVVTLLNDA